MKKILIVFMSLVVSNVTLATALTHLSLDNRTGVRELPATGVNLRYDASWYGNGASAKVEDNGTVIASGASGDFTWRPTDDGVHMLKLSVFDGAGSPVGSATAQFGGNSGEGGGSEGTICTITFDANGGSCSTSSRQYTIGSTLGTLPTATWGLNESFGWFTAAVGGTRVTGATVVTGDATYYARWESPVIAPEEDPASQPMDADVANVYDGIVAYDDVGQPDGFINVKVGKVSKKGVCKVTAVIQVAGEKKVTVKGEFRVADGEFTATTKDGRVLGLVFTHNTIVGYFDDFSLGYFIEGTRNQIASSGSSAEKSTAEAAVNRLVGNYTIAYRFKDEKGWNDFSLAVMKKGKCKISGRLSNGKSVSTTSQLIVGRDCCCVPVVGAANWDCCRSPIDFTFSIYFPNDGTKPFTLCFANVVVAPVTALGSGRAFRMDSEDCDSLYDAIYGMYGREIEDEFLPYGDGVPVEQRGAKWIVANGVKAGKIKVDREKGMYDANGSANPSGLKLSFTAKTGLFKGSFKIYTIDENVKLKSFTATVNGIVVDGCGYGTATLKKPACTFPVTIE